jgi:hypothetical protein
MTPGRPGIPIPISPRYPALGLILLCCLAVPARADRLVLLDGSTQEAALAALDAAGRMTTAQGRTLDLQDLRSIERSGPGAPPATPRVLILLAGQGLVLADSAVTDGRDCLVDWVWGRGLRIPMNLVRAIVLKPALDRAGAPILDPAFAAALAGEPDKQDRLFVRHRERYASVAGVVQSLGDDALTFATGADSTPVPRDRIYGAILAQIGAGPDLAGQCLVQMADGSALWGSAAGCDGKTLHLTLGGHSVDLPWDSVCRVRVRSTRMVFVSDLDPVRTQIDPDLSIAGWWRDAAMWGRPLRAGGRVYPKGIGAHAVCRLTYDLAGKFDTFAAVLALDPLKSTRGRCDFVVRGDNRELFRATVASGAAPQPVQVKIAGVRELTLALERSEAPADGTPDDRNFGAHGNWCDARLIREGR